MSRGGIGEPAGDDRVAVGAARPEPLLEHGARGRQDENRDALGHALADLARPLPVDLEQHAAARGPLRADLLATGAVVVVEHLGVLEKGAARDQLLELRLADEMVLAPGNFLRAALSAWCARPTPRARRAPSAGP